MIDHKRLGQGRDRASTHRNRNLMPLAPETVVKAFWMMNVVATVAMVVCILFIPGCDGDDHGGFAGDAVGDIVGNGGW